MTDEVKAPEPGSDEYNALLAAKFDNPGEPAENKPDVLPTPKMPELGVEKFYNAESGEYDWQSHAKDAEYRVSQKAGKDVKDVKDGTPDQMKIGDKDKAAQSLVDKAGLDINELGDQIRANGELDATAKTALMGQGVPEQLIDEYVELAKYRIEGETNSALEYAGGEDSWNTLSTWAAANLPEDEKISLNKMLAGGQHTVAIDALKARMAKASPTGQESKLLSGDRSGSGAAGYGSRAEMLVDQKSKQYKNDPSFRAEVIARIAATSEETMYPSYD